MSGLHENLKRESAADTALPSNRNFGFVFTGFFAFVTLIGWWKTAHIPWKPPLLSALFLLVTLIAPGLLSPLNKIWAKFGLLLHKIVSPLAMGIIFFVVLTPMSVVMRLLGKDPMRSRWEPESASYWVNRIKDPAIESSMRDQF